MRDITPIFFAGCIHIIILLPFRKLLRAVCDAFAPAAVALRRRKGWLAERNNF
jgi:hypothetical protein